MLHTEDNAEILICDRSNGKIIYPTVYTERERSEYSSAFVNNANWEIMIRTPVVEYKDKYNIYFIDFCGFVCNITSVCLLDKPNYRKRSYKTDFTISKSRLQN